jgi:hypothetical protein
MPNQRSQGRTRTQNYRPDEMPPSPSTALTAIAAPNHDPATGRFVAGNRAQRRRQIKACAKGFTTLDPSKCDPWLRPFVALAIEQATDMIEALPVQSTALSALAADVATARAVYLGLLQLGATGDPKALDESKGWLREYRQGLLALKGMANDEASNAPKGIESTDDYMARTRAYREARKKQ